MLVDDGRESAHGATTGQACVNSRIFTVFHSIRRPYITIELPRRDMDTPPRPLNLFPLLANRICNFRRLWNGMFDHHQAEITVMQFTGHPLPVHQFVTAPWDFNLVPYCQASCILQLTCTLGVGLTQNFELKILRSTYWPG